MTIKKDRADQQINPYLSAKDSVRERAAAKKRYWDAKSDEYWLQEEIKHEAELQAMPLAQSVALRIAYLGIDDF